MINTKPITPLLRQQPNDINGKKQDKITIKNQLLTDFTDAFDEIDSLIGSGIDAKMLLDIVFYIHQHPNSTDNQSNTPNIKKLRNCINQLSLNTRSSIFSKTYTRGFCKILAYIYIHNTEIKDAFKNKFLNINGVNGFKQFMNDNGYGDIIKDINSNYIANIHTLENDTHIKFGNTGYTQTVSIESIYRQSPPKIEYKEAELLILKELVLLNKNNSSKLDSIVTDHFKRTLVQHGTNSEKKYTLINNFIANYVESTNVEKILDKLITADSNIYSNENQQADIINFFNHLTKENQLKLLALLKAHPNSMSEDAITSLVHGILNTIESKQNKRSSQDLEQYSAKYYNALIGIIEHFKIEIAESHISRKNTIGYALLSHLHEKKYVKLIPDKLKNFGDKNYRRLFHELLLEQISPHSVKKSAYLTDNEYIDFKLQWQIMSNAENLNDIINNLKNYSYLLPQEYQITSLKKITLDVLLNNDSVAKKIYAMIKKDFKNISILIEHLMSHQNSLPCLDDEKDIYTYVENFLPLMNFEKSPIKNQISYLINEKIINKSFQLKDELNEITQQTYRAIWYSLYFMYDGTKDTFQSTPPIKDAIYKTADGVYFQIINGKINNKFALIDIRKPPTWTNNSKIQHNDIIDLFSGYTQDKKLTNEYRIVEKALAKKPREWGFYDHNGMIISKYKHYLINQLIDDPKITDTFIQFIAQSLHLLPLTNTQYINDKMLSALRDDNRTILKLTKSILNTYLEKPQYNTEFFGRNCCYSSEQQDELLLEFGTTLLNAFVTKHNQNINNELITQQHDLIKKIMGHKTFTDHVQKYLNSDLLEEQNRVFELQEFLYAIIQDQSLTLNQLTQILTIQSEKDLSKDTINKILDDKNNHDKVKEILFKIVTRRDNKQLGLTTTYKLLTKVIKDIIPLQDLKGLKFNRQTSLNSNNSNSTKDSLLDSSPDSSPINLRKTTDLSTSLKDKLNKVEFITKIEQIANQFCASNQTILQHIASNSSFSKIIRTDRQEATIGILTALANNSASVIEIIQALNGIPTSNEFIKSHIQNLRTSRGVFAKSTDKTESCEKIIEALTRAYLNNTATIIQKENDQHNLDKAKIAINILNDESFIKNTLSYAQKTTQHDNLRLQDIHEFFVGFSFMPKLTSNNVISLLKQCVETPYSFVNKIITGRTTKYYKSTKISRTIITKLENAQKLLLKENERISNLSYKI